MNGICLQYMKKIYTSVVSNVGIRIGIILAGIKCLKKSGFVFALL